MKIIPDKASHMALLLLMLLCATCVFAYGRRILREAYPPPSPHIHVDFVIGDTLTNGVGEVETQEQ